MADRTRVYGAPAPEAADWTPKSASCSKWGPASHRRPTMCQSTQRWRIRLRNREASRLFEADHDQGQRLAVAGADHLTAVLCKSGVLGSGWVRDVIVDSDRSTVLSRILRLRLAHGGPAPNAPDSVIVKTGLAHTMDPAWNGGRQEVAFYTKVAPRAFQPSRAALFRRPVGPHLRRMASDSGRPLGQPLHRDAMAAARRTRRSARPS